MKKINLRSPRYVLPILSLPFLLILFYVYSQSLGKGVELPSRNEGVNASVSPVSPEVSGKGLSDKLQAFKDRYRESDGYTAISSVEGEPLTRQAASSPYNERERRMLDSISERVKAQFGRPAGSQPPVSRAGQSHQQTMGRPNTSSALAQDRALAAALNAIEKRRSPDVPSQRASAEQDPMSLFRAQMSLIDSMGKANDPAAQKKASVDGTGQHAKPPAAPEPLRVELPIQKGGNDNTVLAGAQLPIQIPAIIDDELTGLSGSRIRIRLLRDINVGGTRVKRDNYLYGMITGFSAQRVNISIVSILHLGQILPVRLEVYDLDGIKGLYVPSSAFREFSRELGSSGSQGIVLDASATGDKQFMSILGRMFQSTTSAVNKLVRTNKAKLKYATQILLVAPDQLQGPQNKT